MRHLMPFGRFMVSSLPATGSPRIVALVPMCQYSERMPSKKYRTASYLPDHLAGFYEKSGNNGMPWGKWDSRYVPVGIRE